MTVLIWFRLCRGVTAPPAMDTQAHQLSRGVVLPPLHKSLQLTERSQRMRVHTHVRDAKKKGEKKVCVSFFHLFFFACVQGLWMLSAAVYGCELLRLLIRCQPGDRQHNVGGGGGGGDDGGGRGCRRCRRTAPWRHIPVELTYARHE